MTDRNLCIRVDEELFKKIKIKVVSEGKTLKDYLLELILKDLDKK